jgi:tetratricopeptide (TPR) repeat protein
MVCEGGMASEPFIASFNGVFKALRACALACCWAGFAHAQEGGDLQVQILYAFHTQDANHLLEIKQTLRNDVQKDKASAATRYHLAHADWRLAQLTGAVHRDQAQQALQECVDQLNVLLEAGQSSVESLALQSACYSDLANFKKMQSALLRARGAARLVEARHIAPSNPRVKLVGALAQLERTAPTEPIPRELIEAAEAFEHSPATGNESPCWGHAETYLRYGHELRVRGDVLGARNWIEKALIAAPDYKAAESELARLGR